MSTIKVNTIKPQTGTTLTLGDEATLLSGSGKAIMLGGFETQGDVNLSGSLYASGSAEVNGFVQTLGVGNSTTVSKAITIPANYNSVLYGPITITETMTITSGAAVKIKDIEDA